MNIPKMLLGWKGYAIAIAGSALIAGAGATFVTLAVKNGEIAKIEKAQADADRESTQAALTLFQNTAASINARAFEFTEIKEQLNARFGTISKDLRHAIASRPLPVGCPAPDAERVRSIERAVAATNEAAAAGR